MCSNQDLTSIDLNTLIFKIKCLKDLSNIEYLKPDFISDEPDCDELDAVPLRNIIVYNTYSGLSCNLVDIDKVYKLGKKAVRDSYLFIEYTGSVIAPYNTGCIRCSLKTGELAKISSLSDGFGVDIRSDILSICTSPSIVVYKFILPKNKVLLDDSIFCTSEGYGKNINLFIFFSRYKNDTSTKYTMIEYRKDEDDDWHILSLKSKQDFEHFLSDRTDNPLLEALYKRLKLIYKNTDFKYLGYN